MNNFPLLTGQIYAKSHTTQIRLHNLRGKLESRLSCRLFAGIKPPLGHLWHTVESQLKISVFLLLVNLFLTPPGCLCLHGLNSDSFFLFMA